LLVATILSAQCTDERVNQVTPLLFAEYPTPELLAQADPSHLEEIIKSTGFYRAKAANLIAMAEAITNKFKGKVPKQMDDLVTLPGVGRKTANVILSVEYDLPGLPVDTHVQRLTARLGLTTETTPEKIEMDISPLLKPKELGVFSLRLILHGRKVCKARKPLCEICSMADICPSSSGLSRK
jgi:endonuclease-3